MTARSTVAIELDRSTARQLEEFARRVNAALRAMSPDLGNLRRPVTPAELGRVLVSEYATKGEEAGRGESAFRICGWELVALLVVRHRAGGPARLRDSAAWDAFAAEWERARAKAKQLLTRLREQFPGWE